MHKQPCFECTEVFYFTFLHVPVFLKHRWVKQQRSNILLYSIAVPYINLNRWQIKNKANIIIG